MAAAQHSFLVEYCRNCDGGAQEKDTAVKAIKDVVPNADVEIVCHDKYPVFVKVTWKNQNNQVLFSDHQRNLFKKYPDLRAKSIQTIQEGIKNKL